MKSFRLFLFLGFLLFAGSAYAQFGRSFGFWAGPSFTWHSYDYYTLGYRYIASPQPSPAFGLYLETNRSVHFGVQTELAFVCRGSSTRTESVTVHPLEGGRIHENLGEAVTSRYRYLSLSPMLRYRTGERWVPYLVGGPRLDVLLYYSTEADIRTGGRNLFVVGVVAGAGAEIPVGRLSLDLSVRYFHDASPAVRNDVLLVSGRGLMATAGIRWNREEPADP
jgi:hypothetical protein